MDTSIVKHISTLRGKVGLLTVLTIAILLGTTPLAADDADPAETYRPTLWRPQTLGVSVGSFAQDDDPLSILWIPHLTAGVRETRIAGAGGIVLDDGTTGGAVAIAAPIPRPAPVTSACRPASRGPRLCGPVRPSATSEAANRHSGRPGGAAMEIVLSLKRFSRCGQDLVVG